MDIQIHLLTGARAGLVIRFSGDTVLVGRHPEADLQLDPTGDPEVSARHAVLARDGGHWAVHDLASRNGTYVNGRRVDGEQVLADGDRVAFGEHGPTVELRIPAPAPGAAEGPGTRVSRRVAPGHTRRWQAAAAGLALTLLAVVAVFLHAERTQREAWARERLAMQARVDSALSAGERTVHLLEGQVAGLATALRESQEQVRATRAALARAEAADDASQVRELRRQLQSAVGAMNRQQSAAGLDFRMIQRDNRPAVAVVYVEAEDGLVTSGTAFAVRPDATLVTSRHVLLGPDGRQRPRRIAIQFSDSDQVWPARLLRASPEQDLALVKVDNIVGATPIVRGLSLRPDTLLPGSPVAVIGYPLGGEERAPGSAAALARPLLSAGVVDRAAPGALEVRGYGASGASGSPIFDAEGKVIAVLFGGRRSAAGQVLLAVPAPAIQRLLEDGR